MKVMTILGTRPEIIRLCLIIRKLDKLTRHVLVHTGQNYDANLNDVFLRELGVRKADYCLNARGSFAEQIGIIMSGMEQILRAEKPDRFLVLGDTNSSLAALVAKRLGIPVYHMEAGNRCYDDRVPEEVNRRVIDHCSDVLMPYSEISRQNLLREGIEPDRILVTGNPINEVLRAFSGRAAASTVLARLGLEPGRYFLATMHREENVDVKSRLAELVAAMRTLAHRYRYPVIVSMHPRTRKRIKQFGIAVKDRNIRFLEPFGFFDFVSLEKSAFCVLSDSGTVQEECAIFGVPNVTLRDVTERRETVEVGSNVLAGANKAAVLRCVKAVAALPRQWRAIPEYAVEDVSSTVVKIVLSHRGRQCVSDETPRRLV